MRFLHLADVHLDTTFAGRSEAVRRRLREASRQAFGRAVDLAVRERVHAVLIAGDLFDSDRLSFQTERFLLDQARRLAGHGVTVVYASGNHDPGSGAHGPRTLPWPDNVEVVGDAVPRRIAVRDASGATRGWVTAVGHAEAGETRDLSRTLPRPEGGLPEVALLHTQVHASLGADAHHAYAPSELSYLVRAGYDYWALGHVHVRQALSDDPPVHYAGNLQGRTHSDTGPRGALLVDLSDRAVPSVSFRELSTVRWETLRVGDLEGAQNLDRLEDRVTRAWASAREEQPGAPDTEWMIRVVLEGASPLWRELRRDEDRAHLATALSDRLDALEVVVVADRVHPMVAVEDYRPRVDTLGQALRFLGDVRGGRARLETLDAGDLAGAPADGGTPVEAYVRRLLEGADGELIARFLGSDGGSG